MAVGYEIPAECAGRLRMGTCSWKYDSWKGLVYDPGRRYRAEDYLADYARHFNTVEIDQWFWSLFAGGVRLPDPEVVRRYVGSVPEGFRFSIKAPNAITLTHAYAKQPQGAERQAGRPNEHFLSLDLLHRFLETLGPMAGKLGPILFQFEYLNRQKMASLAVFIERLEAFFGAAPGGFQYGVEVRNPNYLQGEFVEALGRMGVGFVLLDGYYMPPLAEVAGRLDIRTGPFSVIRLLGPDRAGIEKETGGTWNAIAEPRDDGLQATADIVRQNVDFGVDTYVNVNNHYEGSAPLTIQRLLDLLRQSRIGAADRKGGTAKLV